MNAWHRLVPALLVTLSASAEESYLVPPDEPVAGLSQEDWSRVWWQWAATFERPEGPTRPKTYAPNAWGLYDMHGNAREWCGTVSTPPSSDERDAARSRTTKGAAPAPPPAPKGGSPVLRGGSFVLDARACRSDARHAVPSQYHSLDLGLRPLLPAR